MESRADNMRVCLAFFGEEELMKGIDSLKSWRKVKVGTLKRGECTKNGMLTQSGRNGADS